MILHVRFEHIFAVAMTAIAACAVDDEATPSPEPEPEPCEAHCDGAPVRGTWSQVGRVVQAQHAALLRNGKVLLWRLTPSIWDPATNEVRPAIPSGDTPFNGGQAFLPDGKLLVVGGGMGATLEMGLQTHDTAQTFDAGAPAASAWSPLSSTLKNRWYPVPVVLGSGAVLVASGDLDHPAQNSHAELYDPVARRWVPVLVDSGGGGSFLPSADMMPTTFLLPSGSIVRLPIADENGRITGGARLRLDGPLLPTRFLDGTELRVLSSKQGWTPFLSNLRRRMAGAAVLLIDDTGASPVTKILTAGGVSDIAELVDVTDEANPTVVESRLAFFRANHTGLVVLPNGQVLAFDGSNTTAQPPEVFDGVGWTVAGPAPRFGRSHHGVAVQLPDGRILLSSDGGPSKPFRTDESMELFSPTYVTQARPAITTAPASARHRSTINVRSSLAPARVGSVTLLRPASVTHATDSGQRYIKLRFERSGSDLRVTLPAADTAPPGDYLLHVVDGRGVPSPGRFIRIAP